MACSSLAAIDYLETHPELVRDLRDKTRYFRAGLERIGYRPLITESAIVPIIVGETAFAIAISDKLLKTGVFVTGFGYPVVPEGTARIRVQISAALTKDEMDRALAAFERVGKEQACFELCALGHRPEAERYARTHGNLEPCLHAPSRRRIATLSAQHPDGVALLRYCAGVIIHDAQRLDRIVFRSPHPLFVPKSGPELHGAVGHVVFPSGIDRRGEREFDIYYGMADFEIGRGRLTLDSLNWLRGVDLNHRPSGYEPDELPDCSTPR